MQEQFCVGFLVCVSISRDKISVGDVSRHTHTHTCVWDGWLGDSEQMREADELQGHLKWETNSTQKAVCFSMHACTGGNLVQQLHLGTLLPPANFYPLAKCKKKWSRVVKSPAICQKCTRTLSVCQSNTRIRSKRTSLMVMLRNDD